MILGRAPLAQIMILVDFDPTKAGEVTKPFVMNPDAFIACKKLDVDWEIAPERVKKVFNQPIRVPKEKEAKDA